MPDFSTTFFVRVLNPATAGRSFCLRDLESRFYNYRKMAEVSACAIWNQDFTTTEKCSGAN
jgi:hypothetical protein